MTSKNKNRNDVEEEQELCQQRGGMLFRSKNGVEEEQEEEWCQGGT
jgi:hypothetical protein